MSLIMVEDFTLEVLYSPQTFEKSQNMSFFYKKICILLKNDRFYKFVRVSALRVRRPETRLTVYWASQ